MSPSTSGSAANSVKDSPGVSMAKSDAEASAEDLQGAPETLNLSEADELEAANSKDDSDGGKIKALLGILRRMMGVKDLAAIRLSLPANLLEPVPNLEYWNYLDRGDIFSVIGDFEDPLDRMLATLRFAFTKELKFVHGKVCKPYNSILGEHFRCHWTVKTPEILENGDMLPRTALLVQQPRPLPNSRGKIANPSSAQALASTEQSSATSRDDSVQSSERASTPTNDTTIESTTSSSKVKETTASGKDEGSNANGGISRPKPAPRGISNLSNLTVGSNASADGEPSKARRGLSRLLHPSRNNKSSSNSIKSTESASVSTSPSSSGGAAPSSQQGSKLSGAATDSQKSSDADSEAKNDNDGDDGGDDASDAGSFKTTKSSNDTPATADEGISLERRVAFITEQVSHHPPISSFFVECKESGVQLYGVDQLSAKFTGTNVKIYSGNYNQGIFVRLTDKAKCKAAGEEYQITHPTASINGLLRGSLWVSIAGTTSVTCRSGERGSNDSGKRLRTLIEYKDEGWVGRAKYALEGVIFEYDAAKEGADTEHNSIKDVPSDRVVATLEGTWKGQITWKHKGEKESRLLIDLSELDPIGPKDVRPISEQDEMESRKIWKPVTDAIVSKQFNEATKSKQVIEQAQRDRAAQRKKQGQEFIPRFFERDIDDGRPRLTETGREALDAELSRTTQSKGE